MNSRNQPRNPLKVAGACLSVAALLGAGVWAITSRDSLDEVRRRAKAAGIPTTGAELAPKPGAPAEQNAADLILSYDLAISRERAWSTARASEKERMMAPADTKLNALRQVVDKTYIDFDRDWILNHEQLFQEGPVVKNLIRDLSERAKLHAQQGRFSEAMKDLEVAQQVTKLMHEDVGLIGHLVSVAIHRIKDIAFIDVAATMHSRGQDLAPLQHLLDRESFPSLVRAVKTEAFLVSFTQTLRPPGSGGFGFEDFQRIYLQESIKDLESLEKHPNDVLKAAAEIDARFGKVTGGLNISPGNLMYRESRLPFANMAKASMRARASRQVAAAYMDILAFGSKNGKLPKDLTELGGDRTDPFSGNPLGYARSDGGFKVWSVDIDGLDDGGMSKQELQKRDPSTDSNRGDMVANWWPK